MIRVLALFFSIYLFSHQSFANDNVQQGTVDSVYENFYNGFKNIHKYHGLPRDELEAMHTAINTIKNTLNMIRVGSELEATHANLIRGTLATVNLYMLGLEIKNEFRSKYLNTLNDLSKIADIVVEHPVVSKYCK